jgi:O-antigen/teichoic acid export membrane protein
MPVARRQLFRNATLTAVQVVVSALFMFFVYKFLLAAIGPEQLGVWSIVMAVSTLARITDLGFAGGMTRFVAKYRALDQQESVLEVVETGTISLAILAAGMLGLSYPLLAILLPLFMEPAAARDALTLLPFSLLSFGLLAVAGSFLSSLDGLQRADLRNLLLISGTLVYGVLIPACVNTMGFVGLGWAQLAQSGCILIGALFVLRSQLNLGWWPTRWRKDRFREMLGYNVSLQITTLAAFLGDPLTKLMLGHFGGMGSVAYYEMATKMVNQFRAVVTNVNQVMVPVITHLHERGDAELAPLYRQTYSLMFFVCTSFYAGAILAVPSISWLWIGESHPFFIHVAYVLMLTMLLNTLTAPAYFSNMGTGHANANAASQVILGAANLCAGWVLGSLFAGAGVVTAYSVAVVIGSSYLMWRFFNLHAFSVRDLLPQTGLVSALITLSTAGSAALMATHIHNRLGLAALCLGGIAVISIIVWKNPALGQLRTFARKGRQQAEPGGI